MARPNYLRLFDNPPFRLRSTIDNSSNTALLIPSNLETFTAPPATMDSILDQYKTRNNQYFQTVFYLYKTLETDMCGSYYKSLESNFKDVIFNDAFCKIKVGDDQFYYVGSGMVLDSNMCPIMTSELELQRVVEDDKIKFHILHPIIRIAPRCFIHKNDSMMRFITGKFLSSMLGNTYYCSGYYPGSRLIRDPNYLVKVIIEDYPYKIISPAVPDIHTSTEGLIKRALDHIDNVLL